MALETFHVVFGQMVFNNQNTLNQARTVIESRMSRPRFNDVEPTIFEVPAGKYGAGPTLVVTLRMVDIADADQLWSDASARFNVLQPGSVMQQSTVTQDNSTGAGSTTVIHLVHFPAAVGDVP